VHADNVRYVHWLDGSPIQVSVAELRRRRDARIAALPTGYCVVCSQHKLSRPHQHECAAGIEEREERAKVMREAQGVLV